MEHESTTVLEQLSSRESKGRRVVTDVLMKGCVLFLVLAED